MGCHPVIILFMLSGLDRTFVPPLMQQMTNPMQPCRQTPWGSTSAWLERPLSTLDDPRNIPHHTAVKALTSVLQSQSLADVTMTSGLGTRMFPPSEAVRLSGGFFLAPSAAHKLSKIS